MINRIIVKEGVRIFLASSKRKLFGAKKYAGSDEDICNSIVLDCWNKTFFQVSNGHFCQFYARDFGWTIDSLIYLGKTEEVQKTLKYALEIYVKNKKISVAITPNGIPYDFPDFPSIDSVAYFFRSLRVAKAHELVQTHKQFLEAELVRISTYITKEGILDPDTNFSGMRDYALRKSACYDNVFLAMLSKEANTLRLKNPLNCFDFKKIIKKKFWNGSYFKNDIYDETFASDANIYPFCFGLFDLKLRSDKKMFESVMVEIKKRKLVDPLPLIYSEDKSMSKDKTKMIFIEFFVPNWEKQYSWTMMGFKYVELLSKIDPANAKKHLLNFKKVILKHKNVRELYDQNKNPYKSMFYSADESMCWCANYLKLKKELNVK